MNEILVPAAAEWIMEKLNAAGHEAYAVGGCVRDSLLGREPEDWDITTSAKPEQVKAIFERTIDTGILHGTVTVLVNHVGYEITTYRVDGEYGDGRHPNSVEFTSNVLEDLKRRDFTINAMAYCKQSGLVDAFGGREDLKNGIVRCVGNASDRFGEDALRILRAIRFSAQLDFQIEEETFQAIAGVAPNMARVSRERIMAELTKLLVSAHPGRIRLVHELGISPYISEGFWKTGAVKTERIAGLPARKALRWAGFLRELDGAAAAAVCRELKMDNDTTNTVKILVSMWREKIPVNRPAIRRVMSRLTPELFDDLLLFTAVFSDAGYVSQIEAVRRESEAIRAAKDCVRFKDMAVSGKDLIAAGMKPGPGLGRTLQELFEMVLDHPEWNEKERLMRAAFEKTNLSTRF